MIVSTPREVLWAFVNSRLGIPLSEDFRGVGWVQGGCLQAVVGYNGFTGRSCFMHSAIDDPAVINRTFVRAVFEYPFIQCGLTHILAMVEDSNPKSLKLCKQIGFKVVHRLEGAGLEGADLLLLELKRNECRWINGKEKRSPGT